VSHQPIHNTLKRSLSHQSLDRVRDCKGLVPIFIGTGAKRSPEKPDPCVAWVTPESIYSLDFFVGLTLKN
ncbi:hypothetical protein, partial [Pedobacter psychrodurus]|uniref:hypothetical protein n=1 Tax=Pedobacter psychrodurus TaxID=2530456 RepID=UPI002930FB26